MYRLNRFLELNWQARLSLAEAALALAAVSVAIRAAGYRRTHAALNRFSPPVSASSTAPDGTDGIVMELSWAIAAAAHHAPFHTTCLHRTLTLWWLLRRRGIESEIRIGTAKTNGSMHAHAWLERGGVVLNDDADVSERFAAFEQFR